MKKNGKAKWSLISVVLTMLLLSFVVPAYAASGDNGIPDGYVPDEYNGIPAQQFKDVFETELIPVTGIGVVPDHHVNTFTETIHFRIFNSTTQETEYEVDTINDGLGNHTLPDLLLKKNHNYIFFVEDPWFQLGTKKYVQVLGADAKMAKEGAGAYDYKYITKDDEGNDVYNVEYKKLTEINVFKRDTQCADPREDARCCIGCTAVPVVVEYKGQPVTEQLKFRFVSDIETVQGMTNAKPETAGQGLLYANLLEDVTYMVYLESDGYVMDPFPIVVKDKSEYGEGRFAYNHTTCVRVDAQHPIKLYDTIEEAHTDYTLGDREPSVTSLKGRVTVTGMSFRHLLILDRVLDNSLAPGMEGKNCEVIGITAVNPHRWEICKILGTTFNITKKIDGGKLVTHVYYIKDGKLSEIPFTQKSGSEVSFNMNSLSLYPVVIEYDSEKTFDQKQAEDKAAKEKAEREAAAKKKAAKLAAWKGKIDKNFPVPKVTAPKAAKKSMTVKWKKLSKKQLKKAGNVKIEIQYSPNKKFPMEETKSQYVSKTKTSAKIKSLKSKKTYYVRVRTVRTIKGVKHVSKWSKTKKIKVK